MIVIKVFKDDINSGLKSVNVSLSITTALMPWLLNEVDSGALALIFSLLIIPDAH
jgi:hypothetical protein